MSKMLKNVFLSVGIFAFTLALVGALSTNKAEAVATCTVVTTGTWDGTADAVQAGTGTATWTGCTGGAGKTPQTTDTIEIPDNVVLSVTGNATVAAIIIDTTATGANGIIVADTKTLTDAATVVYTANSGAHAQSITLAGSGTLTVAGAVTLNAPSNASGTATLAIGAGTLGANSLAIVGGTGISTVTLGVSGHLTIATNVTLSGTAANARLTTAGTGAKTIAITGNLVDGGTVTFGGTVLTSTVTGTTTISNGATITASDATGTYTYGGVFTVNAGGVYNETALGTSFTFTGAINNAGTFTTNATSADPHTFGGNITNSGTGTFNYAGNVTLTKLQAATTEGTVNYTGAGQAIQIIGYHNLGLSGSGTKTTTAALIIGGELAISGTANVSLTTDNSTANTLKFGGAAKILGTWGSSGSTATRTNDTYFLAEATGKVAVNAGTAGSAGNRSGGVTITYTPPVVTTTPDTNTITITFVPATPAIPGEIPGCGNRTTGFSASSGVSCVGNTSTIPASPASGEIPGCGNKITGFSASSGLSCVGNKVTGVTSYNFGSVTLKVGSTGAGVMELQRFLNVKLNLGLAVDGKLGSKTIAVIKKWQAVNGLVADGLVGAKTKVKMNASL